MTSGDVRAVDDCANLAFGELGARTHQLWPEPTSEDKRRQHARFAHLLRQDAGGCWVATAEDAVVGAAVAILREGVWGLSLLVVAPEHQGAGVGRVLLDRALAYGDGGERGGIILSSNDPAAIRCYRRAGFELRPALIAHGSPLPAERLPGGAPVRAGSAADLAFCEEVGRLVRGASHGPDLRALIEGGCELVIAEDGGFCIHLDSTPRLLAARDEESARSLLLAVLAAAPAGKTAFVPFLDERQAWAMDCALAAGLELEPGGPVCVRGELGPMAPYLPSSAYL
jgi:GNAT superfamily N-acetyltransferase